MKRCQEPNTCSQESVPDTFVCSFSADITIGVNTSPSSLGDIFSLGFSGTGGRTLTSLGIGIGGGVQGTLSDAASAASTFGGSRVVGGYGGPFSVEIGQNDNGRGSVGFGV